MRLMIVPTNDLPGQQDGVGLGGGTDGYVLGRCGRWRSGGCACSHRGGHRAEHRLWRGAVQTDVLDLIKTQIEKCGGFVDAAPQGSERLFRRGLMSLTFSVA